MIRNRLQIWHFGLFRAFCTFDYKRHFIWSMVHDRIEFLAMEKNWSTQTWWHRLFANLLGMIRTDVFLGYRIEFWNKQMGENYHSKVFSIDSQQRCATSTRCRGRWSSAFKLKYTKIIALSHVYMFTTFYLFSLTFIQDHRP